MTIILDTPLSLRIDRVVGDVCSLQHDDTPARARAPPVQRSAPLRPGLGRYW